jgi:hypothetical protein
VCYIDTEVSRERERERGARKGRTDKDFFITFEAYLQRRIE